jgi:Tfp pilus assembly protein PilF
MNVFSSDFVSLLYIPVLISTLLVLRNNWHSLWDSSITREDRNILKQVAFFLGFPLITLVHEFGHYLAYTLMGIPVSKFHYALYWGYVAVDRAISPQQAFIGALAGNALEIAIALVLVGIARYSKIPGVVALCVYIACMSIGGDLIVYPLLSFMGYYGDWTQLYGSPIYAWSIPLGIVHISLVVTLIWCLKSNRVKFWYIKKTNAQWFQEYDYLVAKANLEPSTENWLALAWSYYGEELFDHARKCIDRALSLDADCADAYILLGLISLDKEKLEEAEKYFTLAAEKSSNTGTQNDNPEMARAYIAIASIYERNRDFQKAQIYYEKASMACLALGDAKALLGIMLNHLARYSEACQILSEAESLVFMDNNLKVRIETELKLARHKLNR